jgi:hypothetical protein
VGNGREEQEECEEREEREERGEGEREKNDGQRKTSWQRQKALLLVRASQLTVVPHVPHVPHLPPRSVLLVPQLDPLDSFALGSRVINPQGDDATWLLPFQGVAQVGLGLHRLAFH